MHEVEDLVHFAAGETVGSDVPHEQVSVCSIGDQLLSRLLKLFGHCARVCYDLHAVLFEGWCRDLL